MSHKEEKHYTGGVQVETIAADVGSGDNDGLTRAVETFRERGRDAKSNAQAAMRAAESWPLVKTSEAWQTNCERAHEDYESGAFIVQRLGGQGALEPLLMATLLELRNRLIDEMAISSASEFMLIDLAILAYANALRVQSWVGNLAFLVEAECFGLDAPRIMYNKSGRRGDRLSAEEHIERLRDNLLPLIDRANRMFIRNLHAIKEMRQVASPAVSVGLAGQVNVGRF